MPIRQGQVSHVQCEMIKMQLIGNTDVPSTHRERTVHDCGHDVFAKCQEVLREAHVRESLVN